jgi:hypothetical protein
MLKYIFIFPFFSIFFISCDESEKEIIELPALRASSIYDNDSVYTYLQTYKEENKEIAWSYYQKGLDIKESNPKKAIYFIKRAITLHPGLEYYKELGALLLKEGMYREANMLYYLISMKGQVKKNNDWVSMYIFSEPDEDTFYEYILSEVLDNNYRYFDGYLLSKARDLTFDINNIKNRLLSDQRFKADTSSEFYKNMMLQFMSEDEIELFKKSEKAFHSLLLEIPESSGVFEITENQVKEFKYDNSYYDGEIRISDIYIYFLKEKLDNPDKWFECNYNWKIQLNDSVTGIIYSIDTSATACPKEMRHIYYRLATYGKKGNIIDSKVVGLQSGEDLVTMKYHTDKFTLSEFKRQWKQAYNKNNFDNEIIKIEKVSDKFYSVKPNGEIEDITNSILGKPTVVVVSDSAI